MRGGMTAAAAQDALTRRFARGGVDLPALDARVLLLHATGMSHARLIAAPETPLTAAQARRLAAFARRRLAGEPVSRIRGVREFYGREFVITPDVLDPRPDTETVVTAALAAAARRGAPERPLRIADAGTGSGAILLTLLAELAGARGVGTDISEAALAVASENARRLGVAGRAAFVRGDWLEGAGGGFDIVTSNPPYIPSTDIPGLPREVALFDPLPALDGGPDGLAAFRALAAQAGGALAPGGFIVVECGAGQAGAVEALFRDAGFSADPGIGPRFCDLAGVERALVLQKSGEIGRTRRGKSL